MRRELHNVASFVALVPGLAFTDYELFPWCICNGCGMPAGNAYPCGPLVPSPIVGLACATIVETRFFELAMSLLDFSPRVPLGTFSILLNKFHVSTIYLPQWQFQAFHGNPCSMIFLESRAISHIMRADIEIVNIFPWQFMKIYQFWQMFYTTKLPVIMSLVWFPCPDYVWIMLHFATYIFMSQWLYRTIARKTEQVQIG